MNIATEKAATSRPEWTGELVKKLHINRITYDDLAKELFYSRAYICMIMSGIRQPKGAEKKLNDAFEAIMARRAS